MEIIVYSFILIFLTTVIDLSYTSETESLYHAPFWVQMPKVITFQIVGFFLHFFSDQIVVDSNLLELGTSDFFVTIGPPCSGSVGISLFMTAAAGIYYTKRSSLLKSKFQFLAMVSIGLVLSLFGNAFRIFLLVLIGHKGHGEIALQGFHSSAGILFFIVLMGLFLFVYIKLNAKNKVSFRYHHHELIKNNDAYPYVFPLMLWLIAGFFARPFYFYWDWGYSLKVIFFIYVFVLFRRWVFLNINIKQFFLPVILGSAIGIVWVFHASSSRPEFNPNYFYSANLFFTGTWLILKMVGFCLIVPFVEELFFRGFLPRILMGIEFKKIPVGNFSVLSFSLSVLFFALLHVDFSLGLVAGVGFNLCLMVTKSLGSTILCHSIANLTIAIFVLTQSRWDLWQ